MKKTVKVLGIFIGIIALLGVIVYAVFNEKRPDAQPNAQADSLAKKMLAVGQLHEVVS